MPTKSSIREEFEKELDKVSPPDARYKSVALWAARWIADYLSKEADSKESWDCSTFAKEILKLAKELQ